MPSTMNLDELVNRFRERAKHAQEDGKALLAQDFMTAAQVVEEWVRMRTSLAVASL